MLLMEGGFGEGTACWLYKNIPTYNYTRTYHQSHICVFMTRVYTSFNPIYTLVTQILIEYLNTLCFYIKNLIKTTFCTAEHQD